MKGRNGYAPEFLDFPDEVKTAWEWIMAFDAWDYGEPDMLCDLILSDKVMPAELKPALAKRINGEKKPNKKSISQQKLSRTDRLWIATHFSTHMAFSKFAETPWVLEMKADDARKEVIDVKRKQQEYRRAGLQKVAQRFGISTETLENAVRDIRKKAKSYPDV